MGASTRWRAFVRWFRPHASASLALGLGIAIGIGCRYPADWNLPDNTVAMFAAIIGALATAAAVVIGVDLQSSNEVTKEATRQADLRMRLKITLQPFFLDLQIAHRDMGVPSKRSWVANHLVADTEAAIDRIRSSKLINEGLDNDGLIGLTYIEMKMSTILPLARNLVTITALCDAGQTPVTPLGEVLTSLASISNEMMDEVFVLAGGDPLDEWKLPMP